MLISVQNFVVAFLSNVINLKLLQKFFVAALPEEEPIITFAASVSLRLGHATAALQFIMT